MGCWCFTKNHIKIRSGLSYFIQDFIDHTPNASDSLWGKKKNRRFNANPWNTPSRSWSFLVMVPIKSDLLKWGFMGKDSSSVKWDLPIITIILTFTSTLTHYRKWKPPTCLLHVTPAASKTFQTNLLVSMDKNNSKVGRDQLAPSGNLDIVTLRDIVNMDWDGGICSYPMLLHQADEFCLCQVVWWWGLSLSQLSLGTGKRNQR